MADTHGAVTRSLATAAVAIMLAMVVACMAYGDVQPRVREVGEALVVAGHQRAHARRRTATMVVMVAWQCGLTYACLVALAAQGGGVDHGRATCEVDWVTV